MTPEEKQLLVKDLCARLPYGVKINIWNDYTLTMEDKELSAYHLVAASYDFEYRKLRPYLRPLSSMTEKEKISYHKTQWEYQAEYCDPEYFDGLESYDWLNAHHFDYRGLIPMGLALEALDGMYKTE